MTENATTTSPIEISIVIPVYKAERCLDVLYERLADVMEKLRLTYEIVFVEDCGPDQSWPILVRLAKSHPQVRAIRLSRNFGQHAAITAGLDQARGKWAVVMDCDLQDPPESIPRLIEAARQGFDVVLGRRATRGHSAFRRLASNAYFKALGLLTNQEYDGSYGSFSLISRKVIDAFLRIQDNDRHYLLVLRWLGFRTTSIEYDQQVRFAGRSSYSLFGLLRHALGGIFFQTTVLLHWIVYTGFFVSSCGIALAAYYVTCYFTGNVPSGFTSLAVLVLTMSGFIIFSLGVVALYIGKVFEQSKRRQVFVIDQVVCGNEEAADEVSADRIHEAADRPLQTDSIRPLSGTSPRD